MGLYLFRNPKTDEILEIFQGMNDNHTYEKDGIKYERIFTRPQAAIDTKLNFRDSKSFADYTGKKKGTMGDMYDLAKECSLKREEKDGRDSIKDKYYSEWSQKRRSKKHPDVLKKEAKERLSKRGVEIE